MQAECGASESNIDYFGNDIMRFGVSGPIERQLAECCGACAAEPRCAGFTVNGGACNVKSILAGRITVAGAISVRRQ
ncbi:hypothetical protein ACHHYP_04370 [Achlya hypogyna]|uniref:Apple domain-containing protein n=1 Tax=Achlya hypogyna TaxID=1202772 RepID=A0A1V9Z1A6_ACHHY|nr:hypothetical protein ACHHYP_04370 [Achlya hypogyna]